MLVPLSAAPTEVGRSSCTAAHTAPEAVFTSAVHAPLLLDPAHSRVVRHPLAQGGFAGLAEGHPLTTAHATQLKSEQAPKGEPQGRAGRIAPVVVAHSLAQVLGTGPVRHVPRGYTDVEQAPGVQVRVGHRSLMKCHP